MRNSAAVFTVFPLFLASQIHQPANAQQPALSQTRTNHVAASITKPCVQPDYPIEAVRQNLQGTTKVRFSVNRFGEVTKADLIASSGSDILDHATISALSRCPFKPGVRDGIPIDSATVIEYVWKIE